ncbi:uncharacterized protein MKK02DRAFT_40473, partial [Dioszegia hungarica]
MPGNEMHFSADISQADRTYMEQLGNTLPESEKNKFILTVNRNVSSEKTPHATVAIKKGKMPIPHSHNARMWDGLNSTLSEQLSWMDGQFDETGLSEDKKTEKWLEYIPVEKKKAIQGLLAVHGISLADWLKVKDFLTEYYPDRSKEPVQPQQLYEIAIKFSAEKIEQQEDWVKYTEAFASAQSRLDPQAKVLGLDYTINQAFFIGIHVFWQQRLLQDIKPQQTANGVDFEEGGYPPQRRVMAQMAKYLRPGNVTERLVAERLNPTMPKATDLAALAEAEKDRWSTSRKEKKNEEEERDRPIRVAVPKKPVSTSEIDDLVTKMSQLRASAASIVDQFEWHEKQGQYTALRSMLEAKNSHQASVYGPYLPGANKFTVRKASAVTVESLCLNMASFFDDDSPVWDGQRVDAMVTHAAANSVDLSQLQGLLDQANKIRSGHPRQWREQPDYRTVVAQLEGLVPGLRSFLPKPLDPGKKPFGGYQASGLGGQGYPNQKQAFVSSQAPFMSRANACNFCKEPGHVSRNCPVAQGFADKKIIWQCKDQCKEQGWWFWVVPNRPDSKKPIHAHPSDGSRAQTIRDALAEGQQEAMSIHMIQQSHDNSMYGEEDSAFSYGANSAEILPCPVIGPDGNVYTGPIWRPRKSSKATVEAMPVEVDKEVMSALTNQFLRDIKLGEAEA